MAGTGERAETAGAAEASSRLTELKGRVERASALISKLRESNQALTGEVAELHRRVQELEAARPVESPPVESEPDAGSGEHEQLELLLRERKTIRRKIQKLLERIERLEA